MFAKPGHKARGILVAGPLALPCALGPAGIVRRKREGDGGTPAGCYPLRSCFYRADRGPQPRTLLPIRATRPLDGWCDDPAEAAYNRPVRLPHRGSFERMWRDDRLYDIGIVIGFNHSHPRKRQGSAIFLHVMAPAGTPTAGCVALRPADLRRLLPRLSGRCVIGIG